MSAAIPMSEMPLSGDQDVSTRLALGQALALASSLLLHVAAALLLLTWQAEPPQSAATTSVEARLIALPALLQSPQQPQHKPRQQPQAAPPEPQSALPEPAPAAEAELARRRIARDEQLRQQRVEQQRIERERLERHQREQAEQRALAEAQAAQQARLEAERAAQAAVAAEAASRRYEPIEKIAPGYPARAMERRIEGDCTVRYTVSSSGRVENPEVIGDCHPLFAIPSLTAAKRFRYQPRTIDGRAVAVPGVTNTFHYRIQPQN